jgi:periplasmic divalent cation tolerance protein
MAEYVQVLTTVDNEEAGVMLARGIVEARLAACVQIVGPIRSVYWWEGKVDEAREWQLLMKTTNERLPELEEHIKANHSYDTPEIIETEIIGGSAEYLGWVSEETRQAGPSS